jgi:hypothetical protein
MAEERETLSSRCVVEMGVAAGDQRRRRLQRTGGVNLDAA